MVNKRQAENARSKISAISKPKEAKTMAKKATVAVRGRADSLNGSAWSRL